MFDSKKFEGANQNIIIPLAIGINVHLKQVKPDRHESQKESMDTEIDRDFQEKFIIPYDEFYFTQY
jgi:hypothetical protein